MDEIQWYILDKKKNVIPTDRETGATFFEDFENRRVAYTEGEEYRVSTVFLGFNHSYDDNACIVFETMVFPSMKNKPFCFDEIEMIRCSTYQEALDTHSQMYDKYITPHPKKDD